MARKEPWRVRASQAGAYTACDYRAVLDRLIHDNAMPLSPEDLAALEDAKKSSPEADFGTCAHFVLQDGLRCQFPGKPEAFAPEPTEWANAALLAGGDMDICRQRVQACADLGAKLIPALAPDGNPWLAEPHFVTRDSSGHVDFLAQDYSVLIDLKTTGKPPIGGRPKWFYIVQQVVYANIIEDVTGVRPKLARIVTLDRDALWHHDYPIDLTTDAVGFLGVQLRKEAKRLRSKSIADSTFPKIGPHCSDAWCPYKHLCRDQVLPAGSPHIGVQRQFAPGTEFRL